MPCTLDPEPGIGRSLQPTRGGCAASVSPWESVLAQAEYTCPEYELRYLVILLFPEHREQHGHQLRRILDGGKACPRLPPSHTVFSFVQYAPYRGWFR